MSRVFLDTNIFIYLIEGKGSHHEMAVALLDRLWERQDEVVTSALTLGELLAKPMAEGDFQMVEQYQRLLQPPIVRVVSFGVETAIPYASVRRDKTIRAPDAIQLACAASASCDLFITNDERLSRKVVSGVQFILSLAHAHI